MKGQIDMTARITHDGTQSQTRQLTGSEQTVRI